MIVGKDAATIPVRNPLSPSALQRKDMRRGRQVAVYDVASSIVVETGAIMSSPYDDKPKPADRESGSKVLLRSDATGETMEYSLYELGVVPDKDDEWCLTQFLLDANRAKRIQAFGGDADIDDPPER